MHDMSKVIEPRSDQKNADDLLAGPITITITSVDIKPGTEQPVVIHYSGEDGRPYKPCKSMCRIMVHAWGPDANKYIGKSITLYCDPDVRWGGVSVGGIRISHMSDLNAKMVVALTVTKSQRKPFTVLPLMPAKQPQRAAQTQVDTPATDEAPAPKASPAVDIIAWAIKNADRAKSWENVEALFLHLETEKTGPWESAQEAGTHIRLYEHIKSLPVYGDGTPMDPHWVEIKKATESDG